MVGATSMLWTRESVLPRLMSRTGGHEGGAHRQKGRIVAMRAIEVGRREHRRGGIERRIAVPRDAGILDAVEIVAFGEHERRRRRNPGRSAGWCRSPTPSAQRNGRFATVVKMRFCREANS